jgi:hypothetical protein
MLRVTRIIYNNSEKQIMCIKTVYKGRKLISYVWL